jgi:putative colanic acid biosynthesis UDP-glucose lipid carrier transferase
MTILDLENAPRQTIARQALVTIPNMTTGLKRALDVTVSTIAIVALSPLLVGLALAVKATSKGPALFTQERYGRNRDVFRCFKFRSMTVCEEGDAFVQCRPGDMRVTALGRFMRRTSMDELPQLLNVLEGSMSLVGPRPHPTSLDDRYSSVIEDYDARFSVKPGMTGLAQVRGQRGPTPTEEIMRRRIESDLEYASEVSVLTDVKLLALTIPSVLKGENAL